MFFMFENWIISVKIGLLQIQEQSFAWAKEYVSCKITRKFECEKKLTKNYSIYVMIASALGPSTTVNCIPIPLSQAVRRNWDLKEIVDKKNKDIKVHLKEKAWPWSILCLHFD